MASELNIQGVRKCFGKGDKAVEVVVGEEIADEATTEDVLPKDAGAGAGTDAEARLGTLAMHGFAARRDPVVRAEVEGGRHVVETRVKIFTPESNPLTGYWREAAQLTCDSGAEVDPAIRSMVSFVGSGKSRS